MSRCVVTVATGRYEQAGLRLQSELSKLDDDSGFFGWLGELPQGSPSHKDRPYAFKAYALQRVSRMYDVLIWADAAVVPVRSMKPLWEKIERDGYWFAVNGWTNYEWTADSAYKDLFPGMPIDRAREENKKFTQILGTTFGISLRSSIGRRFLDEYYRLASETEAFCGPWANANNAEWSHRYGAGSSYTTAPCGPPDVLGHRHDQTAASVIAWRLGMKLTECPEFFSYPSGAIGKTVLVAVGA
jgi:hypothetical protein